MEPVIRRSNRKRLMDGTSTDSGCDWPKETPASGNGYGWLHERRQLSDRGARRWMLCVYATPAAVTRRQLLLIDCIAGM